MKSTVAAPPDESDSIDERRENPDESSGRGGIRTPGTVSRTAVFKTADESPQAHAISSLRDSAAPVLADCLALLAAESPDLALVIEQWDALPEAIRAGIVALVQAAAAGSDSLAREPDAEPTA